MQIRRHLSILYKRFLYRQLGSTHAIWLAARQASALSALKQLTRRGAPPPPPLASSRGTRKITQQVSPEMDIATEPFVERCASVSWRMGGLAASTSGAAGHYAPHTATRQGTLGR